jgi:hypothetical protein
VLALYALFEFVSAARIVGTGLLELAGLVPDGELGDEVLAAGSEAVRDTPRLAAAIDEMLASTDRREHSTDSSRSCSVTARRCSDAGRLKPAGRSRTNGYATIS